MSAPRDCPGCAQGNYCVTHWRAMTPGEQTAARLRRAVRAQAARVESTAPHPLVPWPAPRPRLPQPTRHVVDQAVDVVDQGVDDIEPATTAPPGRYVCSAHTDEPVNARGRGCAVCARHRRRGR